jgi:hypothetical protein
LRPIDNNRRAHSSSFMKQRYRNGPAAQPEETPMQHINHTTRPADNGPSHGNQDAAELIQDLEAPYYGGIDYPSWRADEILPGLFMGGTHDDATVADAMTLRSLGQNSAYDAVVTLYAWAQPVDWEVEELRYGFGDGALYGDDIARVLRAAEWAHQRWQSGDRVLIRCQAGLNRSGLVTALVLIQAGWAAADAIRHIRAKRSPHALFNRHFVRWLITDAQAAVSPPEISLTDFRTCPPIVA